MAYFHMGATSIDSDHSDVRGMPRLPGGLVKHLAHASADANVNVPDTVDALLAEIDSGVAVAV